MATRKNNTNKTPLKAKVYSSRTNLKCEQISNTNNTSTCFRNLYPPKQKDIIIVGGGDPMGRHNQCKHSHTHKQTAYVYVPKFVPPNKSGLRHLWGNHKFCQYPKSQNKARQWEMLSNSNLETPSKYTTKVCN